MNIMGKMPLAQSKILAYLEISGVKRSSECIQEGDKDLPSTRIPLPGGPGSREGPQTDQPLRGHPDCRTPEAVLTVALSGAENEKGNSCCAT